jgi:hypothetical protein
MKTQFASNNLGFSVITAIVALAAMTATTAYLMNISKNATLVSASAKATIYIESERSRISTALADNNTCMRVGNFSGQPPVRGSIASLLSANGSTLVAQNAEYFDKTLRVERIQTRLAVATDLGVDPADIGTARGYVLQIDYLDTTANNMRSAFTGKKQSIIIIPMYMKVVASDVVECFTLAQNSKVNTAIRDSCSPASLASTKNSLLDLTGSVASDCKHSLTFATSAATGDNTVCNSTPSNSAPSTFTALSGWDLVATSSAIDVPTTKCKGIATSCSTVEQSAYTISGSTASCSYAGGARDGACGAGQILYHSSGTGTTCTTISCPGAHSFVRSVAPAGATCFTAPATTCGTNEYVKIFNETGGDVCGILPTMSGNCAAGSYGVSVTRDNATANGTLNCSAYTKTKACATPARYTFATAFGASTTASCTTF